ncbi:hypothetical protein MMC11_002522 [Xylographa trunciseda]|nr:hypothetical protein [Xylographa trunciseda]
MEICEGLQVENIRLKLASYSRAIDLLLAVKCQDMITGLSTQIESSKSDIMSELRIQRSESNAVVDRTSRLMTAELRSAVDPLTSNVEAIRISMDSFVRIWQRQQLGRLPSAELERSGQGLCAIPAEFDWASIDPRFQGVVLQRLYNRHPQFRSAIVADLEAMVREQLILQHYANRTSFLPTVIQKFVNIAVLHVKNMSLLFPSPISSISLIRIRFDRRPHSMNDKAELDESAIEVQSEVVDILIVMFGNDKSSFYCAFTGDLTLPLSASFFLGRNAADAVLQGNYPYRCTFDIALVHRDLRQRRGAEPRIPTIGVDMVVRSNVACVRFYRKTSPSQTQSNKKTMHATQ